MTGPLGDYYLSQTAAGQAQTSPCVDAGDPLATLPYGTTRTDEVPDAPPADIGFHYLYSENPPPTFTPTPTPTPSPIPTRTPSPTPTPTPTPIPVGMRLELSQDHLYSAGNMFWLKCHVSQDNDMLNVPVAILLGVYDEFWFWPSWTQDFDFMLMDFEAGVTTFYGLEPFAWPDVEGHVTGLDFFAALLTPEMNAIFGEPDHVEFGYTDTYPPGYVYIPPGTFMQGSPDYEYCRFLKGPQHQVTLTRGFNMMKTEGTRRQLVRLPAEQPFGQSLQSHAREPHQLSGIPSCKSLS